MSTTPNPGAIADWVTASHSDLLVATLDAATTVALAWEGSKTPDRDRIVGPLRSELRDRGLLDRYASLLAKLQSRVDDDAGPEIVPAPPYVVITSRGPVLRLSVEPERIVIRLHLFEIERGDTVYYRQRAVTPEDVVRVSVR